MTKKILIADDEEVVQKTISRGLAKQPFTFVFASDGLEAIEKAQQETPDLILLDINMPHKDGREVIQDLRKNNLTKNIPVIMLTGLGEMMDKIAGFELGADDYITKPFDLTILLKRIQTIFNR